MPLYASDRTVTRRAVHRLLGMRTLTATLTLAASLGALAADAAATPCVHGTVAPANGTCFDTYRRPDGKVETYYAPRGSRLERGLGMLSDRWDSVAATGDWWRVDDDLPFLPAGLQALGHGGALTTARSLQTSLATRRYADQLPGMTPTFASGLWQLITRPLTFAVLVDWPTGVSLQNGGPAPNQAFLAAAIANAQATQQYHGATVPGFLGYVNAITGLADNPHSDYYCEGVPVTWLGSIGLAMQGMVEIAVATRTPALYAWIRTKLDYIDAHPVGSYPDALLPDRWKPDGQCLNKGPGSDNMYFARALYGAADTIRGSVDALTQGDLATRMEARADAIAIGWTELAVLSNDLFATHMAFDGTPADLVTTGDTKWNALYLLAAAARHADTPQLATGFLDQARRHYQALRANANSGLIDVSYTDDGDPTTRDGNGAIETNAVFVAMALLELHRATQGVTLSADLGPDYFHRAALALIDEIYARRGEGLGSHTLLDNTVNADATGMTEVALGEGTYHRLAVDTPAGGSAFAITRCSGVFMCTSTVLSRTLPAYSRVAVALLPQGTYRVTVGGTARFVTLAGNQTLTF